MAALRGAMGRAAKPPTDHVAGTASGNVGGGGSLPAVPFDPCRRVADPEVAATIASITLDLERQELALGLRTRQRRREAVPVFRVAAEALICNLLVAQFLAQGRPLGVPKSSGAMWRSPRYRAPVYGQPFLDALAVMEEPSVGLIAGLQKGYGSLEGGGKLSTITATGTPADGLPCGFYRMVFLPP